MKLAVTIPTRGLINSKTLESTVFNPILRAIEADFHIVQNLPIPDAHNECVRWAKARKSTHILFVEDDMEIPQGGIEAMLEAISKGERYVSIDYGFKQGDDSFGRNSVCTYEGEVMWTGVGCTMIDLDLFQNEPYFSSDYSYTYTQDPRQAKKIEKKRPYGGHDIHLCYELRKQGIKLHVIPEMRCLHHRIKSYERKLQNSGLYEFEVIT